MVKRLIVCAAILTLMCGAAANATVDKGSGAADGMSRSYWIGGRNVELTEKQAVRQQRCMSLVAYGEARGEGREGMLAIMFVVMNRVRAAANDGDKTPLPCDVVAEKHAFEALHGARFRRALNSIRRGHEPVLLTHSDPAEAAGLDLANSLAREMIDGKLTDDLTGGATHFYCPTQQRLLRRQKPDWAAKLEATAWIGKQVFYR